MYLNESFVSVLLSRSHYGNYLEFSCVSVYDLLQLPINDIHVFVFTIPMYDSRAITDGDLPLSLPLV